MLQHGAEKSIPLSFIYPEFAARGFDSKEEFAEHLLARQQEIHELIRRNTHQAQLRQKLKFDRHLKAKAHMPLAMQSGCFVTLYPKAAPAN